MKLFKVGDKLEPDDYHKVEYGLKYVTITDVNLKDKVYHWEGIWGLSFWSGKI